jgi:hypothetical protein
MKFAHKYKLIVTWSNRKNWDINIISINAKSIDMWLPSENSQLQENEDNYITSIQIVLIQRNFEKVEDTFLAKGID